MTTPTEPGPDDLWGWAGRAYAQPGVEAACLALQDEGGLSVSYLLWAVWAASRGAPGAETFEAAAAIARDWEAAALQPLRAARRGLKAEFSGIDPAGRAALRARIQTEELAAEALLLEALARLPITAGEVAPRAALRRAAGVWGGGPSIAPAIERLADGLGLDEA
jgi:uncharacterized protein (TIGR02444 family)